MVRIICRIKPPKEDNIELISDSKIYLYKKDKNLLDKSIIKPYQYELDKFYDHDVETDVLFESEIKPKLVEDFGVFIYGHTGSGKTFTLFGNNKKKGIFDLISDQFGKSFKLEAIDLRYEGIFDLFSNKKINLCNNGIEDVCQNSEILDITPENYNAYRNIIFESRTRGKSKHNSVSSRSHLVLYIYKNNKKYSIVDLAGNERKPDMFSKINEYETTYINSSLLALKECFRSYGKSYMPYRRSDLTRLLKNIILGKNLIICTIHSGHPFFYDSVDTLNYIYSLLNKVKTKPEFFDKKILPISPKFSKKKGVNGKQSRIDKRCISPRNLFESPNDFIERPDNLSPKSLKFKKELLDGPPNLISDLDDIADEKVYEDFYDDDDFEEIDYDFKDDEVLPKEEKILDMVKYIPKSKDKIDKDINYRRKMVGIINGLLYKKIVSNYKTLLDEDLDDSKIDELIYTTASTLEVSISEIIKM